MDPDVMKFRPEEGHGATNAGLPFLGAIEGDDPIFDIDLGGIGGREEADGEEGKEFCGHGGLLFCYYCSC